MHIEKNRKTENKHSSVPIFKKIDSEDFHDQYDLRKLFLGLQRHIFLIAFCILSFGLFATYVSYRYQTTYQAEAVVLYQEENDVSKELDGGLSLTNLSLPTAMDMIYMPRHFQAIKTALGLDMDYNAIHGMVDIPPPSSDSNMIRIFARTSNPNLSIDIANTLAKISVKSSKEFNVQQVKKVLEAYQNQFAITQRTLSRQNKEIEEFKLRNNYFGMDPEQSSFLAQVDEARRFRDNAEVEYNKIRVQYENLQAETRELPKYLPISPENRDGPLQQRIADLEASVAEARAKYTEGNPKLIQLTEKLRQLYQQSLSAGPEKGKQQLVEKNNLRSDLEVELLHMQGQVRSAEKVKNDAIKKAAVLEKELEGLPVKQMELVKLLQARRITESQLEDMHRAAEKAQLMLNAPKGSLELYSLASEASPWKDSFLVSILPVLGLLFGFGAGVVGALMLETWDSKLRTPKQVDLAYNLPCIGTLPELLGLNRVSAEGKTLFFVRSIAEYFEIQHPGFKSLALISSTSGEGKSLIATFLAAYYKRLGKKVLFIEADPQVNRFNKLKISHSLSDYLQEKCTLEEVVFRGNFDSIKQKKRDPSMKDLLRTPRMQQLWDQLLSQYDMIIIDTPGVVEEDYGVNLMKYTDVSLFIVGSSQTPKHVIDDSLKVLDSLDAPPQALFLNRVRPLYVSDKRVLREVKRTKGAFFRGLFKRLG